MLYLTVLLYIHEGQEAAFAEYEARVRPIMARYGGKMLYRTNPEADSAAAPDQELPYEMHLLSFPDHDAFMAYRQDPERTELAPLQGRIIKRAVVMRNDGVRE